MEQIVKHVQKSGSQSHRTDQGNSELECHHGGGCLRPFGTWGVGVIQYQGLKPLALCRCPFGAQTRAKDRHDHRSPEGTKA
jgi:hypothetical protein